MTARCAVGYVRVSTDRQELSPDAQRAALADWCAKQRVELLSVHEDLGVSGGAGLDQRPGLVAALAALPKGGVLLAAKRDRIARDVVVAAMVERLVERKRGSVRTCDGASDSAGPEGALMRTLLDAFAAYERALIGARTCAALAHKRSRGERTGEVPYGYRLAADGVHLEPEPAEQAALARIRELRSQGLALRAVAERATAEGLRRRSGGAWAHQDVRRVLDPDRARQDAQRRRARRRMRVVVNVA